MIQKISIYLQVIKDFKPIKFMKTYEKLYSRFMTWRTGNDISPLSENFLIIYFEEFYNKIKAKIL